MRRLRGSALLQELRVDRLVGGTSIAGKAWWTLRLPITTAGKGTRGLEESALMGPFGIR